MPIQRIPFGARRRPNGVRLLWMPALAVVILGVFGFFWYQGALLPVDPGSDRRELVTIESGQSASAILSQLEERGVVRSALAAKIYLSLSGRSANLQAGTFVLRPSLSLAEVIDVLALGKAEEIALTIPEGATVADIDLLLARRGLTTTGALLLCAKSCNLSAYPFLPAAGGMAAPGNRIEGYLYPDTYYVETQTFDVAAFVSRLLETFKARVIDAKAQDIERSGRTLQNIVTMASLIERESGPTTEERQTVSGILWKRLDDGTQLGVDASVLYALGRNRGGLTANDLAVNSPYNLRRVRGLPPGPIGSPSLGAIDAALHPLPSPYYYYLHDTAGQIHYAKTLDEHNANKARYLQ